MNPNRFSLLIGGMSLVMFAAWLLILLSVDPVLASAWELVLFYFTLFVALSSGLGLAISLVKKHMHPNILFIRHVQTAYRQGILLGGLIVLALFLLSKQWLTWWVTLLLLVFVGALEYVLHSGPPRKIVSED